MLTKTGIVLDQVEINRRIKEKTLKDWELECYQSFRDNILDKEHPYPCYFAVEAEKKGLSRYIFVQSTTEDELLRLRDGLYEYIKTYRNIGKRTTLVAFFKPPKEVVYAEYYKGQFWKVLQFLMEHDPEPWPRDIPTDPNHPKWEYCFGGEPIFVVCRAPIYHARKSRYTSNGLEITFQPRGTLDDITGDTPRGQQVREIIRARLKQYDAIPPHPDIGDYGDPDKREWKQYILPDTNEESVMRCPLKRRD
ncbi:YqcI/YcgG family protein [Geobacillus thermodenitrificans]|uniref:YqcI/YcgG family protein n=1 Tax=Geobacillus thermodenitrificans TaxID=33940 RepID=UPI002E1ACD5D|nr:hypothetical protein [Geobacillus thermodenitrificans]